MATDIKLLLFYVFRYERDSSPSLPWAPAPAGPSREWRGLVAGLLRVLPAKRYSYLDTLQHAALAHMPAHNIRDQVPSVVYITWVTRETVH